MFVTVVVSSGHIYKYKCVYIWAADLHPPSLWLWWLAPGWTFWPLLGSESAVCGMQEQSCPSPRSRLPPTPQAAPLDVPHSFFFDSYSHDDIGGDRQNCLYGIMCVKWGAHTHTKRESSVVKSTQKFYLCKSKDVKLKCYFGKREVTLTNITWVKVLKYLTFTVLE